MSFIYENKKLILDLIKSGQDFEFKFLKSGQDASRDPVANATYRNYLTLTRKLVDQLEQTSFPKAKDPNAPTEVSTELDASQPLNVTSLTTFGNFLQYIEQNKILVEGKRVAYFGDNPDPKSYFPVSGDLDNMMETGKREAVKQEYYVNPELIGKYLVSLQRLAKEQKDKVLEVMVGKRIEDVNRVFRTNLSKKYKEPERTLPPDEVLTTFPETIDTVTYAKDGNIQLLYKDMSDDTTFRNWAFANKIQLNIPGYEEPLFKVDDDDFDFCALIRAVYSKAKWLLSNRSRSAEEKNKYQIFVAQTEKVSQGIRGPKGEACSLTPGGSRKSQTPGGGGADRRDRGGPGGAGGDNRARIINQLKDMFPYQNDAIDFDRITRFVDKYSQIEPSVTTFAAAVKTQIRKAKSMLGGAATGQLTNEEVDDIQKQLKQPERITEYLLTLQYIIETVAKIMMIFRSKDFNHMDDATKEAFREQIGDGSSDASSIRYDNALTIKEWQSNLSRVVRRT